MNQNNNGNKETSNSNQKGFAPPQQMSLPKGGGAIRGIGEKFSTTPLTGTATITIPIFTTSSRWDFDPKLSVSYDSGSGNSAFGLGWNLSIPSIARKTEKELPRYWDEEKSDTFILSGAEDLVPALNKDDNWKPLVREYGDYDIKYYRPRIEGLFAKIEKWSHKKNRNDVFWRTISKDNVTTLYGKTSQARITDPMDPSCIFKWLIEESYDDKGNAIFYQYKSENEDNIDPSLLQEKNRLENKSSFSNKYLKRIKYGNITPYKKNEVLSERDDWLFEVVFDYGEHDLQNKVFDETRRWLCRLDPFSSYRAGFEIRTYRLCRRILMFHHFDELGDKNYLVRSTDLEYDENEILSFLISVYQTGYIREAENKYRQKSIPPLEFTYTKPIIDDEIHFVDEDSLQNLPIGVDGRHYKLIDMKSEGLSGILTEQAGSWFYKQNIGNGKFGPIQLISPKASLSNLETGEQEIMELADDGEKYLVQFGGNVSGFYRLNTASNQWELFSPFSANPNINWNDANLKFIDLNGDGFSDILISEQNVFVSYISKSTEGFTASQVIHKSDDEEKGPKLVFEDPTESIYIADISGDGQTDIIRIRNGEVCYWPNLGYGHFGAKVTMGNAPYFDHPDQFEQSRIRLADIDGSGITDIIYLGRDTIKFWFNQSGNSWSKEEHKLPVSFPIVDNLSSVMVFDLLGNGTSCIVWSSPLPGERQNMRYIDLMGGKQERTNLRQKPHLIESINNNMGSETRIEYTSSTEFYLEDLDKGKPWITKLPFPVHVVKRVETYDYLTNTKLVSLSKYHHGYYDRDDREFRGFGLVEQEDSESFEQFKHTGLFANLKVEKIQNKEGLHVPPVYTKTWFHTGFHLEGHIVSKYFEKEYYSQKNEKWKDILQDDILLEDTILPQDDKLTFKEEKEACRALKGQILRQEIYARDNSEKSEHPYSVSERNYHLRMIQPILDGNRHAVFYQCEHEVVDIYYERNPKDPRIQHKFILEIDEYGNIKRQATVYYPRRDIGESILIDESKQEEEQFRVRAVVNSTDYTDIILDLGNLSEDNLDSWLIPQPYQSKSYEVKGLRLSEDKPSFFKFDEIERDIVEVIEEKEPLDFGMEFDSDTLKKEARLYSWSRKYYLDDNRKELALSEISIPALVHYTKTAVFPVSYVKKIYEDKVTDEILENEGGYRKDSQYWWNEEIKQQYMAREHFFLPNVTYDPFGSFNVETQEGYYSRLEYEQKYNLIPIKFTDPLQNETTITLNTFDYRLILPKEVIDINGNYSQVIYDELGLVIATTSFGTENDEIRGDGNIIEDGFEIFSDVNIDSILENPNKYIQNATSFFYYDHFAWMRDRLSPNAMTMNRQVHIHHISDILESGENPAFQFLILYVDGLERELQKKIRVEGGLALLKKPNGSYQEEETVERWLTSGSTVYNNKGKPIKQYEPFFSGTSEYESEESLVRFGVTPIIHYDPLERIVRTDTPKGFFSDVKINAWSQIISDENDNVKKSRFFDELINKNIIPNNKDWTNKRIEAEKEALSKSANHVDTPKINHIDNMGRIFLEENSLGINDQRLFTMNKMDILGNKISITDARQYMKNKSREPDKRINNFQYFYDMKNRQLVSKSVDAGIVRLVPNAMNNPAYTWTARQFVVNNSYDKLQRLVQVDVLNGNLQLDNIVEQIKYGESLPETERKKYNLCGKPVEHKDQGGIKEFLLYDINGQNIKNRTRLREEYKKEVDWNLNHGQELLEIDENGLSLYYVSEAIFDVLDRLCIKRQSDGSVQYYKYNQSGLLKTVKAKIPTNSSSDMFQDYVKDIQYNAKGQRLSIQYGNGTRTTYEYERETFRLESLKTHRSTDHSNEFIQEITYVYDPVGNITQITDSSHRIVFNAGEMIKPTSKYEYDSLYRLKHAEGRQHSAVMSDDYKNPDTFKQSRYMSIDALINNPNLLENYEEDYQYDFAGNLEKIKHFVSSNSSRAWTRIQTLADDSNRVISSQIGQQVKNDYFFDAAGNMKQLEQLKEVHYNYRDNISSAVLLNHAEHLSDSEYYVYNSTGIRVRKIMERYVKVNDEFKFLDVDEKIYLDGYEIKLTKRINLENSLSTILLKRISYHIMDDKKHIAIIHSWNTDVNNRETDDLDLVRVHYQISNHLGSCLLEISDAEKVISFEEYYPYGGTSFIAGKSTSSLAKEVSIKDYRFSGKEVDDNTSLYYFGARFYVPWLARWITTDPLIDEINLYQYSQNNPIVLIDPIGTQTKPALTTQDEKNPESSSVTKTETSQGDTDPYAEYNRFKDDPKLFEEPEEVREAIGRTIIMAQARADADERFEAEKKKEQLEEAGIIIWPLEINTNQFRQEFSQNPDYLVAFYEQLETRLDNSTITRAGAGTAGKAIMRNLHKIFPSKMSSEGFRRLIGWYRKGGAKDTHPRGHHPLMQAGFKNHPNYNPNQAFSISPEFMKQMGWSHDAMSTFQKTAYAELAKNLAKSGAKLTETEIMRHHIRIGVGALEAGGATTDQARWLIAWALRVNRQMGVRSSRIPWH